MSERDDLIQRAEDAIGEVFNDVSVSPDKTKEDLEGLAEVIEAFIASLP